MPFEKVPGLPGKVYVPAYDPDAPKKHKCPDCYSCQMCSDDRCHVCLNGQSHCQKPHCGDGGNDPQSDKTDTPEHGANRKDCACNC